MSRHVTISHKEIKDVFQADKGWREERRGKEFAYVYDLKDNAGRPTGIRIVAYSSVHADTGKSRGRGQDAIRVCAVDSRTDRGYIKASRVYRTSGWPDRVRSRTIEVIRKARERYSREQQ